MTNITTQLDKTTPMALVRDVHMTTHIAKHGGKIMMIVSLKMIPLEISSIHVPIMGMPTIPMEETAAHIIPHHGKPL